LKSSLGERGRLFTQQVEKFDAVDGAALLLQTDENTHRGEALVMDCLLEWDATKNAMYDRHIEPPMAKRLSPGEVGCALSHVQLWRELLHCDDLESSTMLILEDDATFYTRKGGDQQSSRGGGRRGHTGRTRKGDTTRLASRGASPGFLEAFSSIWKAMPADWEILYLGFSDRGERIIVPCQQQLEDSSVKVSIFRPTYGFHTHAYALSKSAASILLSNLPVVGPLDVWLADNRWFGLNVYCGVVANEGYHGQGACLVSQRKHDTLSDICQSGRLDTAEDPPC
jgi:GR25 family glycosyltransferase involved in LPS biosynthesis